MVSQSQLFAVHLHPAAAQDPHTEAHLLQRQDEMLDDDWYILVLIQELVSEYELELWVQHGLWS